MRIKGASVQELMNQFADPTPTPAPKATTIVTESQSSQSSLKGSRQGTMRIKGSGASVLNFLSDDDFAAAIVNTPPIAGLKATTSKQAKKAVELQNVKKDGLLKLLKESGMKSTWVKRFIVLHGHSLSYFRTADVRSSFSSSLHFFVM